MTTIKLTDSIPLAVAKLSQGHQPAIPLVLRLMAYTIDLDPNNLNKSIAYLLYLDNLQIYGERILRLYQNVCKGNLARLYTILRAWQLGAIKRPEIDLMISTSASDVIPRLYLLVKKLVENFDKRNTAGIRIVKAPVSGRVS